MYIFQNKDVLDVVNAKIGLLMGINKIRFAKVLTDCFPLNYVLIVSNKIQPIES